MLIGNKWDNILEEEYKKDYFKKLVLFTREEYKNNIIYPKAENVFNALKYTDYDNVKVVILGQDPYINEGEAHGLSFSVLEGATNPPSLINIFKELEADTGIKRNKGDLSDWAKQGVLLLNTVLTVRRKTSASHKNKGWETFTDEIIKKVNEKKNPVVFILWGNYARAKKALITNPIHHIMESTHPSPFSAYNGFFGSKPFSKTNKFLEEHNISKIEW
jgi:uracil-DNA glycosylase